MAEKQARDNPGQAEPGLRAVLAPYSGDSVSIVFYDGEE